MLLRINKINCWHHLIIHIWSHLNYIVYSTPSLSVLLSCITSRTIIPLPWPIRGHKVRTVLQKIIIGSANGPKTIPARCRFGKFLENWNWSYQASNWNGNKRLASDPRRLKRFSAGFPVTLSSSTSSSLDSSALDDCCSSCSFNARLNIRADMILATLLPIPNPSHNSLINLRKRASCSQWLRFGQSHRLQTLNSKPSIPRNLHSQRSASRASKFSSAYLWAELRDSNLDLFVNPKEEIEWLADAT